MNLNQKARLLYLMCISAATLGPLSAMSDTIAPNRFSDRVRAVDESGTILFMEHKPHRLWGIVPEGRSLREIVVGKVLQCEPVAEVKGKVRTNVARCYFGFAETWPEGEFKDLSDYLIKMGAAKEFCAETLGFYETCGSSALETN
jgi:hypothetical protein